MNGIIIINKPKGFTSHDIVNVLRKALNIKKIGHTGTLDPNATGVLPILIGNATKISKYMIEHNKEYIATVYLGEKRSTGDIEGQILKKDEDVKEKLANISKNKVNEVLKSFLGKQKQIPPVYSAIKINGKKAYEYARKGQTVEIRPRDVEIHNIELLSFKEKILSFKVECSKGTYIRTLCEDIAEKLGTIGHMKDLIRTKVDGFTIDDSITIEDIKNNPKSIDEKIISIEDLFKNKAKIVLDERKKELFLNGVKLTWEKQDEVYRVYYKDQFIGLGVIKNKLLKRDVVVI